MNHYTDDRNIITSVDDIPIDYTPSEADGCFAWLIVMGILIASGSVVLMIILSLIALGGWIVGMFS